MKISLIGKENAPNFINPYRSLWEKIKSNKQNRASQLKVIKIIYEGVILILTQITRNQPPMLQPLYHPIIQFLYSLQTSQFFPAYTLFVFSLGLLLIYMFVRYLIITHKLSHQVKNPRTTYYSSKLSKREFEKMKLKQTNEQVTSLMNSTAYRSYLVDRHDPYSMINLRSRMLDTQMADEEVLSDEEEQDDRNNMQRQQ